MERQRIREKQYIDELHLRAPGNWINDPNGFIYYKGKYHLFYQYFPYAPRWGTMHWGHAVSDDLCTWNHQEIALYPSIKGDQNGCFSGSAVEDKDNLFLLYTGVRYLEINPEDVHVCVDEKFEASQCMICSRDGYHFDNEQGKQVIIPPITNPVIGDQTHTRDPKVWRGTDVWYMVLGTRDEDGKGKLLVYESEDLLQWRLKNACAHKTPLGWMCECPDYIQTTQGGILVYSVMGFMDEAGVEPNQTIWMPAEFSEKDGSFTVTGEWRLMDDGLELYAPQSTIDKEGYPVQVSWLRMSKPTKDGWIGMFNLPRRIELKDGKIYANVHPEIQKKFCEPVDVGSDSTITIKEPYRINAFMQEGSHINMGGSTLNYQDGILTLHRKGTGDSCVFCRNSDIVKKNGEDQGCCLDVYVDEYMVEIYINHGECNLTYEEQVMEETCGWSGISEIKFYIMNHNHYS